MHHSLDVTCRVIQTQSFRRMILLVLLVSALSLAHCECKTVEAYDISDLIINGTFNDSYLNYLQNDATYFGIFKIDALGPGENLCFNILYWRGIYCTFHIPVDF